MPLRARLAPLIALAFLAAAAVHGYALATALRPSLREAVFLLVNLGFAMLFAARKRWTIYLAIPFGLQQAMSHGLALLEAANNGRLDAASLAVLLFLPVMLACAMAIQSTSK